MKKLVAKIPILFQGRMYEAGETLPAYDEKMTDAWLRAKSAELIDTDKPKDPPGDDQGTPGALQDGQNNPGDDQHPQGDQGGETGGEDGQNGEDGGEDTAKLMEGHLDPAQLSEMNKPDLEALAKQMGIEIPRGATKALIVERLSAAVVHAPENDGDAQ